MKRKIKVSKKYYDYNCGDGCCYECGYTWYLDDKEVASSPCEDSNLLKLLQALDFDAEIVFLDENGEETSELS
jgi:hypothetical protein